MGSQGVCPRACLWILGGMNWATRDRRADGIAAPETRGGPERRAAGLHPWLPARRRRSKHQLERKLRQQHLHIDLLNQSNLRGISAPTKYLYLYASKGLACPFIQRVTAASVQTMQRQQTQPPSHRPGCLVERRLVTGPLS